MKKIGQIIHGSSIILTVPLAVICCYLETFPWTWMALIFSLLLLLAWSIRKRITKWENVLAEMEEIKQKELRVLAELEFCLLDLQGGLKH